MKTNIDRVVFTEKSPSSNWDMGKTWVISEDPSDFIIKLKKILQDSDSDCLFFHEIDYNIPNQETILKIIDSPGDLWHQGVSYFSNYKFNVLTSIVPAWMYLNDAPSDINSSSWKMNFKCCLIKRSVLNFIPLSLCNYTSLNWFSLDYGYQCLKYGVIPRHTPLLNTISQPQKAIPGLKGELQFIKKNFPHFARNRITGHTTNMGSHVQKRAQLRNYKTTYF